MLKGNKGEWSEIYALCYILNSGRLESADKDLNPLKDMYFPVIKIIREEEHGKILDYITDEKVKIYQGNKLLGEFDKKEFKASVDTMLNKIPQGNKAFSISELDTFFKNIHIHKLKADSLHKQDIKIKVRDSITGISPTLGFSIKSYLGAKPTLINPGMSTNFIYEIQGCNENLYNKVNSIDTNKKIMDRFAVMSESKCRLVFLEMASCNFKENLQFIDSQMDKIVSAALLIAYQNNVKSVPAVINLLKALNPLNFSNVNMYEFKFKKFLCACALGMTPEMKWEGQEDANGGYIVVKKDGSVVCYHIYNRLDFEQYLYEYTNFDSPSTSRYNYAKIYQESGKYKINLNLQVRFNN